MHAKSRTWCRELLAKAGSNAATASSGTLNPVIDALRRNGKIEFIH